VTPAAIQVPKLRARFGSNARQFVLPERDCDRIGGQMLAIYEGFLEVSS
jgi:hypothetical protein